MIRILHVISSMDSRAGGPVIALLGLTWAQADVGLGVAVIATRRAGDDLSACEAMRSRRIGVKMIGPATGPLARHPELPAAVREAIAGADVVHIHGVWEEIQHAAARAARQMHKPYFIRPCGMLDPWSLAQSKWKKRAYLAWRLRSNLNHATALHFTAKLERDLVNPLGLRAPTIVEPNGLSLDEFSVLPQAGVFRSTYRVLTGRPLILFLSRLHPKKGLDFLLPAFAAMNDRTAVLVIAGPDNDGYAAQMQQLSQRLGIADRVLFVGMLLGAQRVAALADADLFVLPSRQENFGIAVVEAMAAGTPVVISDQVNIYGEIVSTGAGSAVPLEVQRLTSELDRWIADPGGRKAAGARGRAFAFENYDWRKIAARWAEHYARTLDPARDAGVEAGAASA